MKTYVIHYYKLAERREALEDRLEKNGLGAEWLVQRGYYTEELVDKYYEYNLKEWKRKARVAERPLIFRRLTKAEMHLSINHFLVGERIAQGEESMALVLEDDAILADDFQGKLQEALSRLEEYDWDIIYLDYGRAKPPELAQPTIIYERGKYDCYGAGAYVVKKSAWVKMFKMREKCTLPVDEEIKYRIKRIGLRPAWVIPPLVTQGSANGSAQESGLNQRDKQGIKRYIFWRRKLYGYMPRRVERTFYQAEESIKKMILGIK